MPDDLINSLDNSSYTEPLAMSRQIDILNNNIPDPGDSASKLKQKRNFLKNKS